MRDWFPVWDGFRTRFAVNAMWAFHAFPFEPDVARVTEHHSFVTTLVFFSSTALHCIA